MPFFIGDFPMWWVRGHQLSKPSVNTRNACSTLALTVTDFLTGTLASLVALIFLIAIHKFEYFLNSKIIGDRIRNPIWLTLLALIIGERLMGIPGMVLAPVVLNYLRREMSKIEAAPQTQKL